MYVFLTLKTV